MTYKPPELLRQDEEDRWFRRLRRTISNAIVIGFIGCCLLAFVVYVASAFLLPMLLQN